MINPGCTGRCPLFCLFRVRVWDVVVSGSLLLMSTTLELTLEVADIYGYLPVRWSHSQSVLVMAQCF